MAVVTELSIRPENRLEQVEHLRRRMAEMTGKAPVPAGVRAPAAGGPQPPAPTHESLLPLPRSAARALPGGLPRGTVASVAGARSLALGIVAAVTAAGGYAAIVGVPDAGLLAAVEMGADLDRLAVVPDPGADPVEVAAVLMDGLDLVLLGLAGRSVAPGRARPVTARARQRGCTLLVADGDWPGAATRLRARVTGCDVTVAGCVPGLGRIGRVRVDVVAGGRGGAGHRRAMGG